MVLVDGHSQILPNLSKPIDIGHVAPKRPIFVLDLKKNDGTTIFGVVFNDDGGDGCEVSLHSSHIDLICGSQRHRCLVFEEVARQSSEVPLCTNVGSWSEEHRHVVFGCEVQEKREIFVLSREVPLALLNLVVVPHHVN